MITVGLVFALLAALVHFFIFWLESLAFSTAGRKTFDVPEGDVAVARPWAFNQGFYNLFLGLGVAVGAIRGLAGQEAGLSWVDFGVLCMFGAAVVLVVSDRGKARGAIVQGTFPLLAIVFLALGHA